MMKKREFDYIPTRAFSFLDKPIVLSKKLGISIINCNDEDIKKNNDIYFTVRLEFNDLKLDLTKNYNCVLENYLNNKNISIKNLSKKMFGKQLNKNDLDNVWSYTNYIFKKNVIVKYEQRYEEIVSYEGKNITRPDETRKIEVINYINFINFLLPYDTQMDQTNFKSEDFHKILDNMAYILISNFTVLDDRKITVKNHIIEWISKAFINCYLFQNQTPYNVKKFIEQGNLNYFSKHENKIIEISNLIERLIENDNDEMLFKYIANTIYVAMNCNDNRTALLLYTSIIEAILTHKPDSNRYNIEDSINKQFCLKICVILEKLDNKVDISRYAKISKLIYIVRSDITHGNVNNIDQIIKQYDKLYSKKEEFKDFKTQYNDVLETLLSEAAWISKQVIDLYLTNTEYIKFIKEN